MKTDVFVKLFKDGEEVEKHQVNMEKPWSVDTDSGGTPVVRFFLLNGQEMAYSLGGYSWSLCYRVYDEKSQNKVWRRR